MSFMGDSSKYKTAHSSYTSGDKIPSGFRKAQLQQYTPQQLDLFKSSFGQVGPDSYFGRLAAGDEGMFNEMEAPQQREFSERLGGIASRFSGMGGLGARKSSGFQNTMTAEASNFAQQLQAQRHQLRQGAIGSLHSMTQDLLSNRPYDRALVEKRQKPLSGWEQAGIGFASGLGEGVGKAIPSMFGA